MSFLLDGLGELIPRPQLLKSLRDFFLTEPDDQIFIWDFSHELRSEVLVGNQDFRSDNASWWITIVDSYRGRRPVLLSPESLLYDQIITIHPRILLDSQVVNALHTYVTLPHVLDPSRHEAIRSFLSFVLSRNFTFDLSPVFYFAETASKSNP